MPSLKSILTPWGIHNANTFMDAVEAEKDVQESIAMLDWFSVRKYLFYRS